MILSGTDSDSEQIITSKKDLAPDLKEWNRKREAAPMLACNAWNCEV
jgi:hypothetical protein